MGPLLIWLFFLAVVGLIVYTTFLGVRDDSPNGQVRTKNMRVIRKRTQLTVVSNDLPTTTTYLVTFQPIYQRRVVEFTVEQQQYESIAEGDVGMLRYKGWQFVSFTPATQNSRT